MAWAQAYEVYSWLEHDADSAQSAQTFDIQLAAGVRKEWTFDNVTLNDARWDSLSAHCGDWLAGHLCYPSIQPDPVGFPSAAFFVPEYLIRVSGDQVLIAAEEAPAAESVFQSIRATVVSPRPPFAPMAARVRHRITRDEYLHSIRQLQQHIQRGDCYEINFCQEYLAEPAEADPLAVYERLREISPTPFMALYRYRHSYCFCASPERFLRKEGSRIFSEPIKGTIRRSAPSDHAADEVLRHSLQHSAKDRSENVMIVDLVRHDLSRVCLPGTVSVPELFGIRSFPQVHHMVSRVEGQLKPGISWTQVLRSCFPMGSMTGAPKIKVMELTETYEAVPRGLFSGTLGYVTPEGDFDFNVVIRSLFYNAQTGHMRFLSGGGITIYSDAASEYEESLLKASALKRLFTPPADDLPKH